MRGEEEKKEGFKEVGRWEGGEASEQEGGWWAGAAGTAKEGKVKEDVGMGPVTRLQARAEAQTLTALAWT
jgi:hypothetical protein